MSAGKRDKLITFNRPTVTRSALGGKSASGTTELGQEWAAVLYGTGAERRSTAAEQGIQGATFQTLANAMTRSVALTDSIAHAGLTYDITGIAEVRRGEFEFTGTASRG